MQFDREFVTQALSDVSILYGNFPRDPGFSVDSRTIQSGDIFVAIPGAHFDGHDFVHEALQKGASGLVISREKKVILDAIKPSIIKDKLVLAVSDTVTALLNLASAWRLKFTGPVFAVTGSVGKTSTKELFSRILTVHGMPHVASIGNQNTKIGAAINMLRLRSEHKTAVFELGISRRGEMRELAQLVRPTAALITNIGHQHMDGLGSLHDIALEKRDVFSCFTEKNIGIINGDQSILSHVSYLHPVLKFGSKTTNQIQARKVRVAGSHISFVLKIYGKKYSITLKNPHIGTVFNSLAATALAHLIEIPVDVIVRAIQMPFVVAGRFEQRPMKAGKGIIIDDCYNANPENMKASLLAFQQIETRAPKIAILGDMLGLGVGSPFWHRQLGRFLRKVPSLRHVILVGNLVKETKEAAPLGLSVDIVGSWQESIEKLYSLINEESIILVKGSSDIGLSNVISELAMPKSPQSL